MCVLVPQVRLYMDCEEYHRVAFSRSPQPLTFEASSGIFVGNAGGTGLARFVVSLDDTIAYSSVCAHDHLLKSFLFCVNISEVWISAMTIDVKYISGCRKQTWRLGRCLFYI